MDGTERTAHGTPALLRSARGAYAQSVRARLHAAGIDDLPRNGVFVLAGLDAAGGPRQNLPAELGVTKQAVSQVVDVLVTRGYLERRPDAGDRRRVVLELPARGRAAVDAAGRGIEAVDRRLETLVSPAQIEAMRSVLAALTEIKATGAARGAMRRRPERLLRRFCPIFPVRDLGAALGHYRALGFDILAHVDGDDYGFANRDGVGLHLSVPSAGGAQHPGTAYLYVLDADALYEQWSRPGIAGHTHPVGTTGYDMREGSHVDPDGNLIRFGSPVGD
ncbi:MAG TPA: MarR family transcriptional regulator [Acidimicrobiales bacterium]|nr:MarR family transcriptional regulator [Acidimicrobiales bacterium]